MANDIAGAKLKVATNSCSILDIEICERDIDEISTVDEHGYPDRHIETYMGESRFAYYCARCTESWSDQEYKTQAEAWDKVKEHFNGES